MKSLFVQASIITIALAVGFHYGAHSQRNDDQEKIERAMSTVERYTDPAILEHAKKVSKITGASVWQVMTGHND